jgi:hypothetical protein
MIQVLHLLDESTLSNLKDIIDSSYIGGYFSILKITNIQHHTIKEFSDNYKFYSISYLLEGNEYEYVLRVDDSVNHPNIYNYIRENVREYKLNKLINY